MGRKRWTSCWNYNNCNEGTHECKPLVDLPCAMKIYIDTATTPLVLSMTHADYALCHLRRVAVYRDEESSITNTNNGGTREKNNNRAFLEAKCNHG